MSTWDFPFKAFFTSNQHQIMKTILLITIINLVCVTHFTWSQESVNAEKPFRPYLSFEASSASSIFSSSSLMKNSMIDAGYDGVLTGISIFGGYYTAFFPDVNQSPGSALTVRYQRRLSSGFAAVYNVLEDYSITGLATDKSIFGINLKISSASILYTLSTPNQRLKTGAGVSYVWLRSTHGYGTNYIENVTGTLGLKVNVTFIFVRVRPFYASFILDGTIAGAVPVGPFDAGQGTWRPENLSLSSLSYGLSIGFDIK